MIKKYSIKELASILGCSLTAVNKKIKPDTNNPDIKRYRNRYETVIENNVTYILLDDEALEDEKKRSKGFKTLLTNGVKNVYGEVESEDIIDVEPIMQQEKQYKLLEFTQRYINDFTTLQKTFYEEMREKDKQIFLLTTSENQKQAEYFEVQALNKQLKKQNNVLVISLTVATTLLITLCITFSFIYINKNENLHKDAVLQHETFTKKPAEVTTPPQVELLDEKETPNQPLPAPHKNRNYKKK
jgi:hypothetical protein